MDFHNRLLCKVKEVRYQQKFVNVISNPYVFIISMLYVICCMLYVFEDEECLAIYGYENILHALFNFPIVYFYRCNENILSQTHTHTHTLMYVYFIY